MKKKPYVLTTWQELTAKAASNRDHESTDPHNHFADSSPYRLFYGVSL